MGDNTKQFSDGEKLIAVMLCELYKHLNVKGVIDPTFIEKVIGSNYYWALPYEYGGIFNDEVTDPHDVEETLDILDMWRFIQGKYKELSDKDKTKVIKETGLKDEDFKFEGFDANNDNHYFIANFLIKELGRFQETYPINSHSAISLEIYRRMLPIYKSIILTIELRNESAADQIIRLFNYRQQS